MIQPEFSTIVHPEDPNRAELSVKVNGRSMTLTFCDLAEADNLMRVAKNGFYLGAQFQRLLMASDEVALEVPHPFLGGF